METVVHKRILFFFLLLVSAVMITNVLYYFAKFMYLPKEVKPLYESIIEIKVSGY
jgi:hypothetical protein